MHFQRLRLSGFKSFVEPTEFRIEPGLTGVVGPNGCGKSNILESLRWVMGANSAKAMRAGGMDDVIFSGSGSRPSRNHAEVALTIDNADGGAPAQFAAEPVLEVVRRIDRGSGSTYRINGREVRARDVQLLFADASTGANSPSLVRQGQISELISAKPQNRRMILEEAGGVSGLHGRRHEAELRLRAAEANMARLDDVSGELETTLGRLKREARSAERFKKLSADIRKLQGAVMFARWSEAAEALERCDAEAAEVARDVERTAAESVQAQTAAILAERAVPPLREQAQGAAAAVHKLAIENDRLEREAQQAAAEVERLTGEVTRIDADKAREAAIVLDAKAALERLASQVAKLEAESADAPARIPELTEAWRIADAERARAEAEVEALAAKVAALDAERRAAHTRQADAQNRVGRSQRALDMAVADRTALSERVDPHAAAAEQRLVEAAGALDTARAALLDAETDHATALAAETTARDAARAAEDELGRLRAEARALARVIAASAAGDFPPVLDQIETDPGYEAALAAALGDDLGASLDAEAASRWAGADAQQASAWPNGAEPLAPHVRAPKALAARLAMIAVCEDGGRLQKQLPPGARLVSRRGDLWRWDGYTVRAEAASPAAIRLEQRRRVAELDAEIARLEPSAAVATTNHAQAAEALKAANEALRNARAVTPAAEKALNAAREEVERHGRESAKRDARLASLDDTISRFEAERVEAEAHLAEAVAAVGALENQPDAAGPLAEARDLALAAREAAAGARAALDIETRQRDARTTQLVVLRDDQADWRRRADVAEGRIAVLAAARTAAETGLSAACEAPARIEAKRAGMLDQLAAAETLKAETTDALDAAETARSNAERTLRAVEAEAAGARERRAGVSARLDAARDRLAEIADQLREATHLEPMGLKRRLEAEAVDLPRDPAQLESRLASLERDRNAIGPVNLRAEEEAKEYETRLGTLKTERDDLASAIGKLRQGIETLNNEGRERLLSAFEIINEQFQALFQALFGGGQAELRLIESDDPLEAGLEVFACPPGKRLAAMTLMSGGEQALTATALIFAVFLANPAPICVLDEIDAPLDDANVDRFCNLLAEMRRRTETRFVTITHNPVTMSRMDRLYGVTMPERGVSQLVSVDLRQAEAMAAQ